ncbi:aromatic acid exporter family protein [Paenibacillus sp. KQZ6P-2]|uniref:Aromatic acid exporter family protein n=1 Tax=Paenibacillus mangrovi TaxID=2931978 RepID=A0A9X1WXG8_9BACL|nr:FUSC family protein [Paenibacillus mangrovi]MCJ8015328.1 aromatic acid exporter family protein [Paenibacillus mangrovi]
MLKRVIKWCARLGLTIHVAKTVLAAAISWSIASLLFGDHYSYFAPLAAVLTVQLTIADTMEKGLYRILGVIIGVAVTVLVVPYVGKNFIGIVIVLLLGMGAATAFKLNPQIISQIGVSSVMVMSFQQAQGYATGRIIETIVGALVAVIIQVAIRPENKVPSAIKRSSSICLKLAERMMQLSKTVSVSYTEMYSDKTDVELMNWSRTLNDAFCGAQKSLKYNFLYRKDSVKLSALQEQVETVQRIIIAVSSVNYAVHEISQQLLQELPIERTLISTAECITTFGKLLRHSTSERMYRIQNQIAKAYEDQLHLFESYTKYQAQAETLIEIGGLFADLHRIVAEVERSIPFLDMSKGTVKSLNFAKREKNSVRRRIAN